MTVDGHFDLYAEVCLGTCWWTCTLSTRYIATIISDIIRMQYIFRNSFIVLEFRPILHITTYHQVIQFPPMAHTRYTLRTWVGTSDSATVWRWSDGLRFLYVPFFGVPGSYVSCPCIYATVLAPCVKIVCINELNPHNNSEAYPCAILFDISNLFPSISTVSMFLIQLSYSIDVACFISVESVCLIV